MCSREQPWAVVAICESPVPARPLLEREQDKRQVLRVVPLPEAQASNSRQVRQRMPRLRRPRIFQCAKRAGQERPCVPQTIGASSLFVRCPWGFVLPNTRTSEVKWKVEDGRCLGSLGLEAASLAASKPTLNPHQSSQLLSGLLSHYWFVVVRRFRNRPAGCQFGSCVVIVCTNP